MIINYKFNLSPPTNVVIRNRPLGHCQTIKPSDNPSFPIDMSSHGHQSTLVCHKCSLTSRLKVQSINQTAINILLKTSLQNARPPKQINIQSSLKTSSRHPYPPTKQKLAQKPHIKSYYIYLTRFKTH